MEEKNPEIVEKEMDFFNNMNDFYISASACKLLLEAPSAWYKRYILKEQEIKSGLHFDEGSLLHAMILEPDTLDDNFINMGINAPGDSVQTILKSLVALGRSVTELDEYSEEIIEHLKEINLYQSLVDDKKANKQGVMLTGDEKRLNKVINETSREYFRLLMEAKTKVIVDAASWDKCLAKRDAVLKNETAKFLLTQSADCEFSTELELKAKVSFLEYKIKGILDSIKVDFNEKTIYVTDLKTTGGGLDNFADAYEKYGYWLQTSIYFLLANSLKRGAASGFTIKVNYVVVDRFNQCYVFNVSQNSINDAVTKLTEVINTKLHYHITKNEFELPYEFANNLVVL